jgi:hypothetical protein
VRGQYDQPEHVVARSQEQLVKARQMWTELHEVHRAPGEREVLLYLKAVEHATNAIASLNDTLLTDRRFLLQAPAVFNAVGRPGLYQGLVGLLGGPNLDKTRMEAWQAAWQSAYQAIPAEQRPARLHLARLHYYLNAITTLVERGQAGMALWPLLRTWSLAIAANPEPGENLETWRSSLEELGLLGEQFFERCAGLDAFLDMADEALEDWAEANGASLA